MNNDNKEQTLSFIEDYKAFECLWNPKHKYYQNKRKRCDALQELGDKYAMSLENVRNKIKSLRSYFVKEHRKCKKKRGSSSDEETYESLWFAYKSLMFIRDNNNFIKMGDSSIHTITKSNRQLETGPKSTRNKPVVNNESITDYESELDETYIEDSTDEDYTIEPKRMKKNIKIENRNENSIKLAILSPSNMANDIKEQTLNFIEDYKALENLWNPKHLHYQNKMKRSDALQQLGDKYSMSIKNVKNKIKSLRSYFAREHHKCCKINSGPTSNETYQSSWFAYKPLMFLRETYIEESTEKVNFIQPIKTNTNIKKRTEERQDEAYNIIKKAAVKISAKEDIDAFCYFVAEKIHKLNSQHRVIAQQQISNILFQLEIQELLPTTSDSINGDTEESIHSDRDILPCDFNIEEDSIQDPMSDLKDNIKKYENTDDELYLIIKE